MEHATIGTAGHVDHGKTALIKRLTGIDTDRLPEEQQRQLSIDLGFAYFDLPSGVRAGIVDVPGHERFIKNMLAGATGIDLVLLVVAADEGAMPQTIEHRDILALLGIRHAVVALTKIDLVDPDWLDLVEDDLRTALRGTPFEHAPTVRLSSTTGQGFAELAETIDAVYAQVPPRDIRGPARLWIDRVFSVRGFGTVVTGTLSRGRLAVEDTVELLPDQSPMRIRAIQVWSRPVQEVRAAQRVALNLSRTEGTGIARGRLIAAPGSMQPTAMLDVRLGLLASAGKALVNRTRIRLHVGTAEILARVALLDCDALAPGDSAIAQLRLERHTAASAGDRFIIRTYSPMTTVGGGQVIDPAPRRHARYDERVIARLRLAEEGGPRDLAEQALRDAGQSPVTAADLARRMQRDVAEVAAVLGELEDSGRARRLAAADSYIHVEPYESVTASVLEALGEHHARQPLSPAMPKGQLRTAIGPVPSALLDGALSRLADEGRIVAHSSGLRLASHNVCLSPDQEAAARRMEAAVRRREFEPLTRDDLLDQVAADACALLDLALHRGTLLEVGEFIYHKDIIERAKKLVREHVARRGPFTVSEFRDLVASSRKYVVPLLEYLDRTGFTRRQRDLHTLGTDAEEGDHGG
ncbi:MAG: selenocysteine-specific translation elongation factor [Armatimonadota bacterium]|jgi:selenocysteine-specific elongation factor